MNISNTMQAFFENLPLKTHFFLTNSVPKLQQLVLVLVMKLYSWQHQLNSFRIIDFIPLK